MKTRLIGILAALFLVAAWANAQTLQFDSEAYNAGESQDTVTLNVMKSGTATGPISVHFATIAEGPGAPFATASADYIAAEGDLTFAPGETMKTIQITINKDAVYEESEIFHVVLSNPTGGAAVRQPSSAQVTIIDDDPAPTVQFGSSTYNVNEGDGFVTLTIKKTGATEATATAYYKTRDGTAKAPSDYWSTGDDLTASVVFEPNETSKEIQIQVKNDGFREPDETFEVFFTVAFNATPGTPGTATVTIFDDDPLADPAPAKALNISTRASVQTGDRILIGGFIITGNQTKYVVIRGLGPSLANAGVPGNAVLLDPMIQLNRADGTVVATNDNWKDDPANQFQFGGTVYQPKDERESLLLATLQGGAYTVFLTGRNQTQGIALVEIYDVNGSGEPELANLSTRGYVGQENDVMIGGFILGNEAGSVQIAVRGLGPSLAKSGLMNVLPDPALELHDANGANLASNDNWETDPVAAAQLTAHGLALPDTKEAGLFVVLPPGQYTAILNGKFVGTGIGLVEVYNLK
jgi:Calx-beta domain-containing protein